VALQASSVSSVSTGNTFNLAVDYTNQASGITAGAARDFQITITLPNGISFDSGACAGTPGTCTISGQTMTIDIGLLAAGSGNTFSIPLVAGANPVGASPITVQATATDQSGQPYQWQDYVIVRIVP